MKFNLYYKKMQIIFLFSVIQWIASVSLKNLPIAWYIHPGCWMKPGHPSRKVLRKLIQIQCYNIMFIQIPIPRTTLFPVLGMQNESFSNRIIVHVCQFFIKPLFRYHGNRMEFVLPDFDFRALPLACLSKNV